MTEMLSVCYSTNDKNDDAAALIVFDKEATRIYKTFYGECAIRLYKELTEEKG